MLVSTVDGACAPASRSGGCQLHQLASERIKRQLLHAPNVITQSGNRQRYPEARQKAQPARSCPPSSSQRSTSLAVSPSSSERSASRRSATSASVRSSGTCSVMFSPAPDLRPRAQCHGTQSQTQGCRGQSAIAERRTSSTAADPTAPGAPRRARFLSLVGRLREECLGALGSAGFNQRRAG